jgi:hypothetical protein
MSRRNSRPRFQSIWEAVVNGNPGDIRTLLDAGTHPDDRGDVDDPTPLMYAAATGRLDIVEMLIDAGADPNLTAEEVVDLPPVPFLEFLYASATLLAMSAPVYAAAYGHRAIYDAVLPRTTLEVRRQAEAVWLARQAYLDSLAEEVRDSSLESQPPKKPKKSQIATARSALLAERPKAKRWIVQCLLCQRQGYKHAMPAEIDQMGTAARVRKLFGSLELEGGICERCRIKARAGLLRAEENRRRKMQALAAYPKDKVIGSKQRKRKDPVKPGENS